MNSELIMRKRINSTTAVPVVFCPGDDATAPQHHYPSPTTTFRIVYSSAGSEPTTDWKQVGALFKEDNY